MNADIKAQWVAALRSGKYQQTQGKLWRPTAQPEIKDVDDEGGPLLVPEAPAGYCCLGVLLEVVKPCNGAFDEHGRFTYAAPEDDEEHEADYAVTLEEEELDRTLLRELGVPHREQQKLVTLNDEDKAPFDVIAAYIEREL